MQYKGTFTDIFAALKAFPNGAGDDDFVVISGKIHRWSKHKGTFVTDTVHAPEMPDNNPVITLFTSLTDGGILTDFMGNKWQLQPWMERVSMPAITVEDVTTDSTYGYPSLTGKRNAVFLVTLEDTDEDESSVLEYKIIKDGDEPASWQPYEDPFTIKSNGVYQIAARARKSGVADSEITKSEAFQVVRLVYETSYGDITITRFTYGTLSSQGGTATPSLQYEQPVIQKYTDGSQSSTSKVTSDATISYQQQATTAAVTSFSTSTGIIVFAANTDPTQRNICAVEVTVSLNSKTKSKTIDVPQKGIEIPMYWGKMDVDTLSASTITAAAVESAVSGGTMNIAYTSGENLAVNVTSQEQAAGTSLVVLVPTGHAGSKFNGITGYVEFADENGSKTTTINGISYKIYGEFVLYAGNYKLKIS